MVPQKLKQYVDAIWTRYDLDRSNTLDLNQFSSFIKDLFNASRAQVPSEEQIQQIFSTIDTDKDKLLNKDEVTRFLGRYFRVEPEKSIEQKVSQKIKKYVEKVWDACDLDKSGSLDQKEFHYFVHALHKLKGDTPAYNQQQISKIFNQIDNNRDGKLSKEEVHSFVNEHFGKQIYNEKEQFEPKGAQSPSKTGPRTVEQHSNSRALTQDQMRHLAQSLAHSQTPAQVRIENRTNGDGSEVQVTYIVYERVIGPQRNTINK